MKNYILKFKISIAIIFFFFGIFGLTKSSKANIVTCIADCGTTCSPTSVSNAIAATSAGGTVIIPAGTCNWNGGITYDKGVTIQGSGQKETVLTQTNSGGTFFSIPSTVSGGDYRITNLSLAGTGGVDITINGNWNSMRIDHIAFTSNSTQAIFVLGPGGATLSDTIAGITQNTKILIHDITYNPGAGKEFIQVWGVSRSWWEDDGLGSDNYVIIEGSTFTFPGADGTVTDSDFGGRITFRYNTVYNGNGVLCHDLGSQRGRGTRLKEIYNNQFICNVSSCGYVFNVDRGGSSLTYNNVITGNWSGISWPEIARMSIDTTQYGGGLCLQTGSRKVCEDMQHHCIGGTKAGWPCYYEWDCPSGACDVGRPKICMGGDKNGQNCSANSECTGTCNLNTHYCNGSGVMYCNQDSDCQRFCGYDISCTSNSDCKRNDGSAGICMQLDGSGANGHAGYPCRDQMGRGRDNATTGVQDSLPSRWWNNSVNGTNVNLSGAYTGYETSGVDFCTTTGTSMPNPCNGINLSYTARACPDVRTGYSGSCSGVGVAGYNAGNDTTPPAPPTGLVIN